MWHRTLCKSLLLVSGLFLCCATRAQEPGDPMPNNVYPRSYSRALSTNVSELLGASDVNVEVGYLGQRSNVVTGPSFWLHGGNLEASIQVYHGLGISCDIAGSTVGRVTSGNKGISIVSATVGPSYKMQRPLGKGDRMFDVFAHGLVGPAYGFNSIFPAATGTKTDATVLALQLGGGFDIVLSRRFAIRVFQADWLRTQFPNSTTNLQNSLRMSTGVVIRF
jgi:hypothetical protein